MHIILGLLGIIGTLAVIIWRIQMTVNATREIADAASDAKGFFRRRRWQNKVNSDQLKQITDPREAATVMMAAVAEADGAMTEREKAVIIQIIKTDFKTSQDVAEEFLARARWHAKDAGDLTSFLNRLKPLIQQTCDEQQKRELIEMLQSVASADGVENTAIRESISRLKFNLV